MDWENLMMSGDASSLNNSQPSVVVEVSCENAWPEDTNNLAYSLLKNGAIATVAGTRDTYYWYGNWTTTSNPGDNASYAYNITQQLLANQSTETMSAALQSACGHASNNQDKIMNALEFVLYGDPSVKPYKAAAGATISGTVWNDANHNGAKDTGETGQSGWTVYLDTNNNGTLDSGEPSVLSGADGSYSFTSLTAGTYVVREMTQSGYTLIVPASGSYSVTLTIGGTATGKDFGNYYGDLTPPTVTGVPNDGLGADIDLQSSVTTISANWAGVFADAESGIAGYQWAIGTTVGGTNIQGYTSLGMLTSATNSSLSLISGTEYFVTVRATNGSGLQSTATSDGVMVDATPPTATGVPNDGTGADIDYQSSTTTLSANWAGVFADAQSGVAGYEWAIGTTAGGTNILGYASVGTATSASGSFSLTSGTKYYVTVRATNGVGLQSTATSDGVTPDTSAPTVTSAPDDGLAADIDYQTSTTTISANWAGSFSDPQSGIAGYEWAIGTGMGGTNIQGYTSVGTSTSATRSGLALISGTKYYVTVRATNGAGLTRTAGTDGVTVDTTPPTVAIGRQTPATSPTNASSVTFLVDFNEGVQNVDAADFTLSLGGTVTSGPCWWAITATATPRRTP